MRPRPKNNVVRFSRRTGRKNPSKRKDAALTWRDLVLPAGVFLLVLIVGLYGARSWFDAGTGLDKSAKSHHFAVCGMMRHTCVVDGDTIWLSGSKVRIADIDTPEISEPKCDSEYARGIEARDRLVELLNAGPFELSPIGDRSTDQYGRELRIILREGQSLGDTLVSEGLARTWTGRREPWC